jgi:autotransporter-associated beta strand protein
MSKKLNHSLAIGIFLIGIFSANVSQAQTYTNLYWSPTNGLGGTGTWNGSNTNWSTSSAGGGTLQTAAPASTSYIYNFSGTAGTVSSSISQPIGGMNWLTTDYILSGTPSVFKYTGTDSTATGTNTISIANSVNLNITGIGGTFDALGMTGGVGSTVTLTNAAGATTTVIFGTSNGKGGRTNSVNTTISGAGTIILGSQAASSGFTQSGNIVNNSTGTFVLTNSATGTVNVSGVISGSGTNGLVLANSSTGKIALNGANTYAGGTTINSTLGDINYGNSSAFGSGTVTVAGAGTNYVRANVNNLTTTNSVNINSGSTLRVGTTNAGHKTTWSGEIGGAGGLNYSFADTGLYLTGTNSSFGNGVTLGSSGTLYVNKLGNAGVNSSIGTNGTIAITATTANRATLRWLGSTNEASDKVFNLSATSTGLAILANGASNAVLTLNGNVNSTASGGTNKSIQLAGYATDSTNGGQNTIVMNGAINENGGINSVLIGGAGNSGIVVLANTNSSFSGGVTIAQATDNRTTTLQTAQIGRAGSNSALGTGGIITFSNTANANLTATVLKYVGSGEVSDKSINLAGTKDATLQQAGSGLLKISGAITSTTGPKVFSLLNSSNSSGELAGNIADGSGAALSLFKGGAGSWTLSGTNSYSGNTKIIDAGSLLTVSGTNALSVNTALLGVSRNDLAAGANALGFGAGGQYTANSYGTSANAGNSLSFTNLSAGAVTLTFTNLNNYMVINEANRVLDVRSTNVGLVFKGALGIGSTAADGISAIGGLGDVSVEGNVTEAASGSFNRTLQKFGSGTLDLQGATNNYRGSTLVDAGVVNLSGSISASTNIVVSTSNSVSSASTTRTATATLDVKSGGSLLNNSTTTVYSGGNLIVNGTAGAVVVQTNGLVGGSGTVASINLQSGAFLTPGNSPGTLNTTSASLLAGSTYNWEIKNADGGPSAAGTNWDLLNVTTVLDLNSLTTSNKLNLVLKSLESSGLAAGNLSNFTVGTDYSWVFAQAGSIINAAFTNGADVTDYFNIDTTAFNGGAQLPSYFKVEVGTTGSGSSTLQTLQLMTIPEPSTGSMFGLGFAGLVVTRLLRRKIS